MKYNFKLVLGLFIFFFLLIFIFILPIFYTVDPYSIVLTEIEKAPSMKNILGTDQTGRDILARLLQGGKISISIGVLTSIIKLFIALVLAFISAFFKKCDSIIMRICDIFMCLPFYVLAISLSAFFGPSIKNLIIIIAFFSFAAPTRLLRTEIIRLKDMEFIQILKINKEKEYKILINHIIPNLLDTILVIFTNSVALAILMESSLSFFGLGVKEPMSSLGSMLSVSLNIFSVQSKLWLWLPAGILIVLLVLSINLISEGLKDAKS